MQLYEIKNTPSKKMSPHCGALLLAPAALEAVKQSNKRWEPFPGETPASASAAIFSPT